MIAFKCPQCDGDNVTLTAEQTFMANSGDHYYFSVKTQDPDSKADCLDCGWAGTRDDLNGKEEPT